MPGKNVAHPHARPNLCDAASRNLTPILSNKRGLLLFPIPRATMHTSRYGALDWEHYLLRPLSLRLPALAAVIARQRSTLYRMGYGYRHAASGPSPSGLSRGEFRYAAINPPHGVQTPTRCQWSVPLGSESSDPSTDTRPVTGVDSIRPSGDVLLREIVSLRCVHLHPDEKKASEITHPGAS